MGPKSPPLPLTPLSSPGLGLYLYGAGVGGLLVDALDQLVADTALVSIDGRRRRVPEIHLVRSDGKGGWSQWGRSQWGVEEQEEDNGMVSVRLDVWFSLCLTPGSKGFGFRLAMSASS